MAAGVESLLSWGLLGGGDGTGVGTSGATLSWCRNVEH